MGYRCSARHLASVLGSKTPLMVVWNFDFPRLMNGDEFKRHVDHHPRWFVRRVDWGPNGIIVKLTGND